MHTCLNVCTDFANLVRRHRLSQDTLDCAFACMQSFRYITFTRTSACTAASSSRTVCFITLIAAAPLFSPSLAIAPAVIAISCFIYLLLHLDQPVLSSQVISSDSHTCCGTGCTFMHIVNNNCLIPVWQLLHSRGSGYAGRLLGRMQLPAGVGAGECGGVRGCINHLLSGEYPLMVSITQTQI